MIIKLTRVFRCPEYTIGKIACGGVVCDSLELPDRGLTSSSTLAEIASAKAKGPTAIPTGLYKIALTVSPRFGGRGWTMKTNNRVPLLLDVPGFEGVRIHPGNTAKDTSGCILPGINSEKGKVLGSQKQYFRLYDEIEAAIGRGESCHIEIV